MAHKTGYDAAHTDDIRTRRSARRRLRREVPGTIAVLADERDFAAMRRYTSFGFDDHPGYLRHVDGLLRALAAQGTYTTVALFDPADYAAYCADLRLDPDSAGSRTRYTAEVAAAGTTVAYDGRPVTRLLPGLIAAAEQQATWEYATGLLTRDGCERCGDDTGRTAFARASLILRRIVEALGPGGHHLVCSIPADGDAPLVALLQADCGTDGRLRLDEPSALVFCTVLAAGIATDRPGGIVARTTALGRPPTVRGWTLRAGWPRPLDEAEVFSAYCTDPATGEPVPPEHGVKYEAGIELEETT
ncbi:MULTISPECIES: hypothetical protein [Streptomyces]|uniref:hypothetical protein n=1 Tax=Streptomyces TaxID=1883 RepID=UPI00163D0460|nr:MULTISPECIES: hypothetical protein [Streptomyces]MBC2879609.1 hypothetical protein [Streptomyces sp. TYQ1024]UBI40157.1 hypothetical protein K7I03_29325 [Streptomyces mobaraensis]UKW32736.1 hypothetical protein MCU78_29255 [Streptomyces sp. TYQ1024]